MLNGLASNSADLHCYAAVDAVFAFDYSSSSCAAYMTAFASQRQTSCDCFSAFDVYVSIVSL